MSVRQLPSALRVLLFLGLLGLLWWPIAWPFYWLADTGRLDLGGAIATGCLYVFFLLLWPWWGHRVHRLAHPWNSLGLVRHVSLLQDGLKGWGVGFGSVALLVILQLTAGWAVAQPVNNLIPLLTEGLLVGGLVGFAEELLFRGWLLFELEQDLPAPVALWVNALIFAAVHFIKPLPAILATLPQFFGLLLLGLTLVWARRTPSPQASLGWPVGLHSGLVGGYYLVNVGALIQVTGTVPDWVTGIQQNPLAGLLGLVLLGGLALGFRRAARPYQPLRPLP